MKMTMLVLLAFSTFPYHNALAGDPKHDRITSEWIGNFCKLNGRTPTETDLVGKNWRCIIRPAYNDYNNSNVAFFQFEKSGNWLSMIGDDRGVWFFDTQSPAPMLSEPWKKVVEKDGTTYSQEYFTGLRVNDNVLYLTLVGQSKDIQGGFIGDKKVSAPFYCGNANWTIGAIGRCTAQ